MTTRPRVSDRFKTPNAMWRWLAARGLPAATVLRRARLPLTLHDGRTNLVTTAQYFAIWRAIAELAPEPGAGLRLASEIDIAHLPPANLAASYANDFRDALGRLARYKQLCRPEEMRIVARGSECTIELVWTYATEAAPPLLTDVAFASFVELGRRSTRGDIRPLRVELLRPREATDPHTAYFGAPVRFRADRNTLVLHARDLDRPFLTHNAELLELLDAPLKRALAEREADDSIGEQVRALLRRQLAGRRPDIDAVARELGVSGRTLQRRIAAAGGNFQQLLGDARRELWREYLTQPDVQLKEVAYLLGYDDVNSFYRAFRAREGTTPAQWRAVHTGARSTLT